MSASLVGSEMCIRDSSGELPKPTAFAMSSKPFSPRSDSISHSRPSRAANCWAQKLTVATLARASPGQKGGGGEG
eukprot:12547885-Alexandrium_andersonii.AAC.1